MAFFSTSVQSSLAAHVAQLQGCLERVESFLARAEATLSRLSLVPAMLKTSPTACPSGEVGASSIEDRGVELYGCFSPREDSSLPLSTLSSIPSIAEGELLSPVLQIMPELPELCVSPTLPLSVEHTKVDSSATLSSHVRSEVTSLPIPPPMAHNPDALLVKELCDLLSGLETAIPGLGKAIACLLTGTPIKGKIKKVGDCSRIAIQKEKSLRCKDKKSGAK
jgi:hypothetical protein